MRTTSLKSALGLATVGAALAFVATGCGTETNHATNAPQPQDVRLTLTTPTTGLRTSADRIAVRGTVSPPIIRVGPATVDEGQSRSRPRDVLEVGCRHGRCPESRV